MAGLKERMLRVLLLPGATRPLAPLLRDRATIFFLHRIAVPDLRVEGHDPAQLRACLAWLRRERYELLPLAEVFRRLAHGEPFHRSVAFTLDDGYFDQATLAAQIFAEYDCPSTTFVATGFLDRELWMWWDRLEYALAESKRERLAVSIPGDPTPVLFEAGPGAAETVRRITERLKRVPDPEKRAAIDAIAAQAEVSLPKTPPARVAAMTWDDLRAAERLGMTFGPHTVTHPILSQTDDAQSRHELETCWRRLGEEAARPVPVFCYPNGTLEDFGPREVRTLADLGLTGAVLGVAGYADRNAYSDPGRGAFRVNRFSYTDRLSYVAQYASGAERAKDLLRGILGR